MFLATGKAETQLATSPLMLYSCFKLLTSLLTSLKTLWYSTCAEDELPHVCVVHAARTVNPSITSPLAIQLLCLAEVYAV